MKFLQKAPDGGVDSGVEGFFLFEIKPMFSVVLLHFKQGTREAFHSHAFNAVTWFVKGNVEERRIDPQNPEKLTVKRFGPSIKPKFTPRDNHHKVVSVGDTWGISLRGPWSDTWREYRLGKFITLTHGRKIVKK